MTDQHQGFNPPHQHGPYQSVPPQYPQQPAGPFGQQPMPPAGMPGPAPSAAPSSKRPLIIAAVVAGVVALVMVFGGITAYNTFVKEDPGIAMCKAMRDGSDTAVDPDPDAKLTEEQYKELRKTFDDSKHEDIRKHGKAMVDLIWQITQIPEGEEAGALMFIGQLTEHMTGLQTACADQGIIINMMDG